MREADFDNMLRILDRKEPSRPTLFELFLNDPLYAKLAGGEIASRTDELARDRMVIHGFRNAGFDYASVSASDFSFPAGEIHQKETRSLNEGGVITDRAGFEAYDWQNPDDFDCSKLERLAPELPEGMKLIVMGPGGVLENAIMLVGFEQLCFILADDPDLSRDIFDAVGSRLVRYYEIAAAYDTVGACIANDDWGFKTQTMLSPADMRKYVFCWHKRIVDTVHKAGKPVILHSCGNFDEVMDDVIDDMRFDGKHSYEDAILPVEKAYERWGGRIAIMGGIDVDFICRSPVEEIRRRSTAMLERTRGRGAYALGTGNSVPEYIPDEKFLAMTSVATGA